jgi:hypothetical protein
MLQGNSALLSELVAFLNAKGQSTHRTGHNDQDARNGDQLGECHCPPLR